MDAKTFLDNFATIAEAPGGIQRLREMVIDLALQGGLSDPDLRDDSVGSLIAVIDSDRENALRTNGWRSAKSAGPIREEELPWPIPDHWAWVRLERLALPQVGFAFKSNQFNQSGRGMPLIRIRDIGNSTTECHFEGDYREEFIVQQGDYLVGMDGNFNIRQWQGAPALLNQRVTRLIFFGDRMQRSFATWALQDRINALHGSRAYTTVQHLSGKQIAAAVIPLPPLAEQERIVAKVDELMDLCDDLEARQERRHRATTRFRSSALHALTEAETADDLRQAWERVSTNWSAVTSHPDSVDALRSSLLELAVCGRLARQDAADETAGEQLRRTIQEREGLVAERLTRVVADDISYARTETLPVGWEWAPLQDLVRFIDYRGRTPTKTTSGVPLVTAKNIRRGFVSEVPREFIAESDYDAWMTRGLPRVGDVLFTTEAPMGNAALIRDVRRFALAQRTITLAPYADFLGAFLELVLLSPWFMDQLKKRATGITATGIKAAKLRLIRIPVPPAAEQRRIVTTASRLLRQSDELESRLHGSSRSAEAVSIGLVTSMGRA